MSLTQREYDLAQLESELRMQKLFDDWRTSFLGDRLRDNTPLELEGEFDIINEEEIENAPIR